MEERGGERRSCSFPPCVSLHEQFSRDAFPPLHQQQLLGNGTGLCLGGVSHTSVSMVRSGGREGREVGGSICLDVTSRYLVFRRKKELLRQHRAGLVAASQYVLPIAALVSQCNCCCCCCRLRYIGACNKYHPPYLMQQIVYQTPCIPIVVKICFGSCGL